VWVATLIPSPKFNMPNASNMATITKAEKSMPYSRITLSEETCCDVRYDYPIKTMFGLFYLWLFVGGLKSYLRYCCVCLRIVVSSTYCVLVLFFFVSCALCFQFLWKQTKHCFYGVIVTDITTRNSEIYIINHVSAEILLKQIDYDVINRHPNILLIVVCQVISVTLLLN
jgi:hypothetical protein